MSNFDVSCYNIDFLSIKAYKKHNLTELSEIQLVITNPLLRGGNMNITLVSYVSSLEKEIQKNKQLLISRGMRSAFRLIKEMAKIKRSNKIINGLFTPTFVDDKVFFNEAIKQCQKVTAELSISLREDLSVKFSFFSKENKKILLYIMDVSYDFESGNKTLGPEVTCCESR